MSPTGDSKRATDRRLPSASTRIKPTPRDAVALNRRERSWHRVQEIRKEAGGLEVCDSGCN